MTSFCAAFAVCSGTILLVVSAPATAGAAVPTLTAEGDGAAGHVTLQWRATGSAPHTEFELQRAPAADFGAARTLYRGSQRASVLSGLPDGTYFFRVRARPGQAMPWDDWSEIRRFTVKHHSPGLAFTLFGLGAAAFLLTLGFLLASARKVRP